MLLLYDLYVFHFTIGRPTHFLRHDVLFCNYYIGVPFFEEEILSSQSNDEFPYKFELSKFEKTIERVLR